MKAFIRKILWFFGVGKHRYILCSFGTLNDIKHVKYICSKCGATIYRPKDDAFISPNEILGCPGKK